MHIEQPAVDFGLSNNYRLPVEAQRARQKLLLIVISGEVDVFDQDRPVTISGPSWVVWFPGERVKYSPTQDSVHWIFALPAQKNLNGHPPPGSMVRLQTNEGVKHACIIEYTDMAPNEGLFFAQVDSLGVRVFSTRTIVDIVEESSDDVCDYDYGPGLDKPQKLQ